MKEETKNKGVRIPISLLEKIEASAKKETRSFSEQVIHIIKTYYELQERK